MLTDEQEKERMLHILALRIFEFERGDWSYHDLVEHIRYMVNEYFAKCSDNTCGNCKLNTGCCYTARHSNGVGCLHHTSLKKLTKKRINELLPLPKGARDF